MSRFLLLNFEDFGLNQDITKTIQPFNPFCICCLDRDGPMFHLEKCDHSDYLDAFSKLELKQFNQLVCRHCHSVLKKIKCFRAQVIESYSILLSGEFTNNTVNRKKLNSLVIQKVVDDLHLPPDTEVLEDLIDENIGNNQDDLCNVQNDLIMEQNFPHNMANVEQNDLIMEQRFPNNMANVEQNESNMEQNFHNNMANVEQNDLIMEQRFPNNMANVKQNDLIMEQSFPHNIANVEQSDSIMEQNLHNNMTNVVQNDSIMEQIFPNNMTNVEQNDSIMEQKFPHNMGNFEQNDSNMEQNFHNNMANVEQNSHIIANVERNDSIMEHNFHNNMANVEQSDLNMEQNFPNNMVNDEQNDSIMEQNFTHNMATVEQNDSNMEPFTNIEEQNRLNKNIKTALEILERNSQSFVSLSSQLQFLNGEHLSFLGPSLLSKEILTDLPLVPAKSTDLESGLLNNSKLEIEMDSTDKMFYDSLDLSPELMVKDTNAEIMEEAAKIATEKEIEPKIRSSATKPKKERKLQKSNSLLQNIRRIKLSHEELDRDRVMQAQSDLYLRYTFRCETCIVSFNYKENLEDHIKRKHGPREGDGVICKICSQLIPNAGCVTEHNYRHYTRYECVRCSKRYHTHDEAMQHCAKHQCTHGTTKRAVKYKPLQPIQLKRPKLKMKPSKV